MRADAGAINDTNDPDPEVPERARGPRRYSAKYKARVLAEYETLDNAGKGALLRREGLYSSLITAWREQRDRGALAKRAGRSRPIRSSGTTRSFVIVSRSSRVSSTARARNSRLPSDTSRASPRQGPLRHAVLHLCFPRIRVRRNPGFRDTPKTTSTGSESVSSRSR